VNSLRSACTGRTGSRSRGRRRRCRRRDVGVRADVAEQLGHEALAEAHDFVVALALGIEVGAALAAAHGERGEAVLEDLLEGQELEDAEVDGRMEAQAALVRADGAVHLDAEAAVDLDGALSSNQGTRNMMTRSGSTIRSSDRGLAPHASSRPRPVPAHHRAPRRRHRGARRQGPPDRRLQLALRSWSCRPSPCAPGTPTTPSRVRGPGQRARHLLHLRPPVLRHPQAGRRRHRRGQPPVRRPRGPDGLRQRLRALGSRATCAARSSSPACWWSASPATTARATAAARSAWATC
jgi:hypothetical protein